MKRKTQPPKPPAKAPAKKAPAKRPAKALSYERLRQIKNQAKGLCACGGQRDGRWKLCPACRERNHLNYWKARGVPPEEVPPQTRHMGGTVHPSSYLAALYRLAPSLPDPVALAAMATISPPTVYRLGKEGNAPSPRVQTKLLMAAHRAGHTLMASTVMAAWEKGGGGA